MTEYVISSGSRYPISAKTQSDPTVVAAYAEITRPGATLESVKTAAEIPRGLNRLYPFEHEVLTDIRDAISLDGLKEKLESVMDDERLYFTFAPGEEVVDLVETRNEVGTVHVVETCYIGPHWGGDCEWVKLTTNNHGVDPDSLIEAKVYFALKEARAGAGTLVRSGDGYRRPQTGEAYTVDLETAKSLVGRGVFRQRGPDDVLTLNEGHKLVKRCGFALPLKQRVEAVLARSGGDADQVIAHLGLKE
jgi:hypothetical protein